jgi:PAS domain S-box-containing protein
VGSTATTPSEKNSHLALGTRASRIRRRRPLLAPISLLVGLGVLLVVVAASFVTRHVVLDQERRLLDERADEVATLLSSTLQNQGASLRGVALVWTATGRQQPQVFKSVVGTIVHQPQTALGVASIGDKTTTPLVGIGRLAPVDHTALVSRANQTNSLVGTVLSDGKRSWLALAEPVPGSPGVVVYIESPVTPGTPIPRTPASPFRELRGALYASEGPDPSQLVFTTDATLPIRGHVVARPVTFGADSWYLVAASREPLAGSLAGRLHWFVLAGGLVAAALAVAVAETLVRRRRYAEDLVEERTAELREREATLAALFRASPDALHIIESDGTIRLASPTMAAQLGGRPEDFVGRSVGEFIHPDDLPRVTDATARLLAGESDRINVEYRARRADRHWMILDSQLALLPGDHARPPAIVAGTRDVTERTRLLQDLQLARTGAEEANRSKNEFLSRMSHELRTPLNAILGFAQLLDLETTSTSEHDTASQIIKAGHHLLDLINEVLDISRIETGHLALSVEPVRVYDVVGEVLALTGSMAAERGIHLPTDPTLNCASHVRADRQRLKQVLLNLVANAIKYNRDGGAVMIGCEIGQEGRFRMKVTDTGSGIEPDKLDRLFTPFERLGAEQSMVEGTGLGLALSKRLIEAMGGTIGVESRPGHGSTFWVELEVTASPVVAAPVVVHPTAVPAASVDQRHVLYVEDNLSNVQLVECILEHRPEVELLVAMQGQLGLELARQHQPDLILIDLNLPDLDGETVLRRLRAEPRTQDIPVVIISADATPGQIARLRASGAADYLTKPFDVARFLRVIDGEYEDRAPTNAEISSDAESPNGHQLRAEIDREIFADLSRSVSPAGLQELIELYTREARRQLRSLHAAVEADDAPALRRVSHQLQGSSASLGATSLAALLEQMQATVDGDKHVQARADTHALLSEVDQHLENVVVALHDAIGVTSS